MSRQLQEELKRLEEIRRMEAMNRETQNREWVNKLDERDEPPCLEY